MVPPKTKERNPAVLNGLNKDFICGAKAMMEADESLGREREYIISAVWEKGVVTDPETKMVAHPPPSIAIGKDIKYPSTLAYCPVVSVACFSLIFMMQAAERNMQFKKFEAEISTDANLSCFYKKQGDPPNPWSKGVDMKICIQGPQTDADIKMLENLANEHCPSVEIMRRSFPVEVTMKGTKEVDVTDEKVYYDMDKYTAKSKQKGPIMVKQSAKLEWYCQNECCEYPDSLMTLMMDQEGGYKLPVSYDIPIASGKYATPVQVCFFGGLSAHLHTVAARIYARGYTIKRILGKVHVFVNERRIMGLERDRYIFPSGGIMELDVESDAPSEVLDEVDWETQDMSPAFMNWTNSIPINVQFQKKI
jgi:uncharacterized OsmC-like protein